MRLHNEKNPHKLNQQCLVCCSTALHRLSYSTRKLRQKSDVKLSAVLGIRGSLIRAQAVKQDNAIDLKALQPKYGW